MKKGPENNFWDWLSGAVGNMWDAQRHEDKYSVGIPDVSFGALKTNGWIELKACDRWPMRGLPKFTSKQANWIKNRAIYGGNCYVMARVNKTILLFNHLVVDKLKEGNETNEQMLRAMAIKIWDDNFNRREFIGIITGSVWDTLNR